MKKYTFLPSSFKKNIIKSCTNKIYICLNYKFNIKDRLLKCDNIYFNFYLLSLANCNYLPIKINVQYRSNTNYIKNKYYTIILNKNLERKYLSLNLSYDFNKLYKKNKYSVFINIIIPTSMGIVVLGTNHCYHKPHLKGLLNKKNYSFSKKIYMAPQYTDISNNINNISTNYDTEPKTNSIDINTFYSIDKNSPNVYYSPIEEKVSSPITKEKDLDKNKTYEETSFEYSNLKEKNKYIYPDNINCPNCVKSILKKSLGYKMEIEVIDSITHLLKGTLCIFDDKYLILKEKEKYHLIKLSSITIMKIYKNIKHSLTKGNSLKINSEIYTTLKYLKYNNIHLCLSDNYFDLSNIIILDFDYDLIKAKSLKEDGNISYYLFIDKLSFIENIPSHIDN